MLRAAFKSLPKYSPVPLPASGRSARQRAATRRLVVSARFFFATLVGGCSPIATTKASDWADCGSPGETCCPTEACAEGGCCVDETCVANGQSCGAGLGACRSGSCGACGAPDQSCCLESLSENCYGSLASANCPGCTAAGSTCSSGDINDGLGTCEACGASGQACCANNVCTEALAVCGVDQECTDDCGAIGQPCCQNDQCKDGGICLDGVQTSLGNECIAPSTCGAKNGQCTTCGAAATPCCSGSLCQVGMCTPEADGGEICYQRTGP